MSDLLGGAGQSDIYIEPDDKRAVSPWFTRPYGHSYGALAEFIPESPTVGGQHTPWWPGGGGLLGSTDTDVGAWAPGQQSSVWYCFPDMVAGRNSRYGFTGVTRDVYGSPLGGVTVKCYHTADDTMVATVVSDSFGNYLVTTPYGLDSHYLVFYLAGTPDVFGTTQNTLVGS